MSVAQQNITASATVVTAQTPVVADPDNFTYNTLAFGSIFNNAETVSISALDGSITGQLTSTSVNRAGIAFTGLDEDIAFVISGTNFNAADNTVTISNGTDEMVVTLSYAFTKDVEGEEGTAYTVTRGTGTTLVQDDMDAEDFVDGAKLFIGGSIDGAQKDGVSTGAYTGTLTVGFILM